MFWRIQHVLFPLLLFLRSPPRQPWIEQTWFGLFLLSFPYFPFKNLAWLPSQKNGQNHMSSHTKICVNRWKQIVITEDWRKISWLIPPETQISSNHSQFPSQISLWQNDCHCFQRDFVVLCVRAHFSGRQNIPSIVTLSGMYRFS